jgi:hypothetical protein
MTRSTLTSLRLLSWAQNSHDGSLSRDLLYFSLGNRCVHCRVLIPSEVRFRKVSRRPHEVGNALVAKMWLGWFHLILHLQARDSKQLSNIFSMT